MKRPLSRARLPELVNPAPLDPRQPLLPGTIIDRYQIERHLANGGFSSVYLARRLSDNRQVAIKEYWPQRFALRTVNDEIKPISPESRWSFVHGKRLFLEETKALTTFKHPNIVSILGFFQENSTAYLVMKYEYGKSLSTCLKEQPLSDYLALSVFACMLKCLHAIHKRGLLHLDIKPGNILLRPGGNPILLDFGAVRSYPKHNRRATAIIRTPGYSPIEQYSRKNKLGPWTDLYALGATLRACIEGSKPQPAPDRFKDDKLQPAVKVFAGQYPLLMLEAIDHAMQMRPSARPQSAVELYRKIAPCL